MKMLRFSVITFDEDPISYGTFSLGNNQSDGKTVYDSFQLGTHHFGRGKYLRHNKQQVFSFPLVNSNKTPFLPNQQTFKQFPSAFNASGHSDLLGPGREGAVAQYQSQMMDG